MNVIERTFAFLGDGTNWQGSQGILARTVEHLGITMFAVAIALVSAVPLGLWAGHTRRGGHALLGFTAALRALPALGLLTLLALWFGVNAIPPLVVIVIIAVAPLLAHTLEAVTGIDPDVVDAARAQGMTEGQILRRVEIPLGLPVFMGGLRSAVLQVIATATIAAYINGNNLGRYLFDGLAVRDYPRMLVATLLVAILAFVVDALMALAQRAVTPVPLRGGSGRGGASKRHRQQKHESALDAANSHTEGAHA